MKILQCVRPSTLLMLLSGVILVLGITLAYVLFKTAEDLQSDAEMINNAGIVRGGIQRLTKLVLANPQQRQNVLIAEIDNLILNINIKIDHDLGDQEDRRLAISLVELEREWKRFKFLLEDYHYKHTEKEKLILTESSEACWVKADNVVFLTQFKTEKKVKSISRVFYFLLLLNFVSVIMVIAILLLSVRNRLEYESSHDGLTGLYNRRAFDAALSLEMARHARYKLAVSLIVFDIDHFKKVNDQYGHRRGDEVLKMLATLSTSLVRETDIVFRIGGEEFAILCPETDVDGARLLAEKIRESIQKKVFDEIGELTVSLGVAGYSTGLSADQFYQNADKALYLAKNNGRNRTEIFI